MTNKKSLGFILDLPPYPFQVYVSFAETNETIRSALGEKVDDEMWVDLLPLIECPFEHGRGRTAQVDNGPLVMRLGVIPETSQDEGVLAHEIFHVVEILFVRLRTPHHFDYTSEVYAYLIQYLHQEIKQRLFTLT